MMHRSARLVFVLPILLYFLFAGCKKTKGPADVSSAQQNNNLDSILSMTATINGKQWRTDSAFTYKVVNSGNDSASINLMITGTQRKNDTVSTISINITDFTGPKTYPVNPPVNSISYYAGNVRHIATSGSFIVATDTGSVLRGTFTFIADTIVAKSGTFKISKP